LSTTARFGHLPIPPGAEADEWMIPTDFPEDVVRSLIWSKHDTAKVSVGVEGEQYGDGEVCKHIALYSKDVHGDLRDLTATDARQLAASLLEAADALDQITGTESP
jgi:hypothetical protein